MDIEDTLAKQALIMDPSAPSFVLKINSVRNEATPFGGFTPVDVEARSKRFGLRLRDEPLYVSICTYSPEEDDWIFVVARK